MIEVPVFNQAGEEIEKIQVDEAKLGGTVRTNLLKQALVMYHANQRQGTVRTLARGEVEGSTRKIYRQKGTGNARMGTIRQPVRVGGGHAKQKRPKDWRQDMPKKAKRLARNSAILAKIQSKDIRVLDKIALEQPKTKQVVAIFKALGIDRSVLVALEAKDVSIERSARNIERTTLTTVRQLNAWDILKNRTLVVTRAGLEEILNPTKAAPEAKAPEPAAQS
jgi:large subunit ribosomal protein L4